jgi:hypothetical protein
MKIDRECHSGKIACRQRSTPDTLIICRCSDYQLAGRLFNGRLMRHSECGTDNEAGRGLCNG